MWSPGAPVESWYWWLAQRNRDALGKRTVRSAAKGKAGSGTGFNGVLRGMEVRRGPCEQSATALGMQQIVHVSLNS